MNRILVPAVLAVALVASSASNASAFGHLSSLFGGCDSGCDVACEPVCGCEPVCCEPVCGVEPMCGREAPCCAPKKQGLLQKLFSCCKKDNSCDAGCCEIVEPACGCEPVCCEPVCGVEPMCGCEPACDSAPCRPFGGLFSRLFCKKSACDSGCCEIVEPTCGCEPTCGVEPMCGCEAPCGCN